MHKGIQGLAAILLLALLVGCGSPTPAADPVQAQPAPAQSAPSQPAPAQASSAPAAPQASGGPAEITVKMGDFQFTPDKLTVPLGAKVKITVKNEGEKKHDLNITLLGIEGDILAPGNSQVFEFTAEKAGTFEIVCSQRGHKDKGMVATLTVK